MLIVCNHCHRHLRHTESSCPFCGTSVSYPINRYGVGLAAALTVVSALGCSDDSNSGGVPLYGPAPTGGNVAQGGSNQGGTSANGGTSQTAPSGGTTAITNTSHVGGGAVPLYGAAPAPANAKS